MKKVIYTSGIILASLNVLVVGLFIEALIFHNSWAFEFFRIHNDPNDLACCLFLDTLPASLTIMCLISCWPVACPTFSTAKMRERDAEVMKPKDLQAEAQALRVRIATEQKELNKIEQELTSSGAYR